LCIMCAIALISCFIWFCISGYINFCLGLIEILFMFFVFSICLGLGNVNTDVCQLFDDEIVAYNNGMKSSDILSSLLGSMGANCSAFLQLELNAISTFDNYTLQFCNQYNGLCNSSGVFGCSNCNTSTNFNYLTQTSYVANIATCPDPGCPVSCVPPFACNLGNVSIAQCASVCKTNSEKNSAVQAVALADSHDKVQALIGLLRPYLGCAFIVQYINAVYDPVCNQFLVGLNLLVMASILIGILLIAFNVLMMFSIHRFDASKREDAMGDEYGGEAWRGDSEETPGYDPSHKNSTWTGTIGFVPTHNINLQNPTTGKPFIVERSTISKNSDSYSFQAKERGGIPAFNMEDKVGGTPNTLEVLGENKGDNYG